MPHDLLFCQSCHCLWCWIVDVIISQWCVGYAQCVCAGFVCLFCFGPSVLHRRAVWQFSLIQQRLRLHINLLKTWMRVPLWKYTQLPVYFLHLPKTWSHLLWLRQWKYSPLLSGLKACFVLCCWIFNPVNVCILSHLHNNAWALLCFVGIYLLNSCANLFSAFKFLLFVSIFYSHFNTEPSFFSFLALLSSSIFTNLLLYQPFEECTPLMTDNQ